LCGGYRAHAPDDVLHLYGVPSKQDPQQRCLCNPNSRPSGTTLAGAPPEASSSPYFRWLFINSTQSGISAAKIGYFLRHARVSLCGDYRAHTPVDVDIPLASERVECFLLGV